MNKSYLRYTFITLIGIGIGVIIGWYYRISYTAKMPGSLIEVRENPISYRFINPLLYTDSTRPAPEFSKLKSILNPYIQTAEDQNLADTISVYFRDLNTGRWIGINENEQYEPSSMLKVLVMMSYLKQAETDPSILEKRLAYVETNDPGQNYKPVAPLKTGTYTVDEIMKSMITQSDNEAVHVLDEGNDKAFYNIYNTLKLPPIPEGEDVSDYMSPKSYSALFRTLYNASYLSNDLSEKALSLLSQTTFNAGIVAGVPQGTTVAHKFGEHSVIDTIGTVQSRELHDCGIVYLPNSPYLLCIMTKGKDFSKLETVISTISKQTYALAGSLGLGQSTVSTNN